MQKRCARPGPVLVSVLAALAPAAALAGPGTARDNIDALIEIQAKANKVPAAFVHRVVKRESNYNPNARGGSALGLMQIKHATARGLGYRGDAAGLYDPETNLKYGIAYLAGAYRAARGDLDQAYRYYNRGYYYVAKQLGITNTVPDDGAVPAATSATGFAGLFDLRPSQSDPAAATAALAYSAAPASTSAFDVPLPPRRPSSLGGMQAGVELASADAPAETAVSMPADGTVEVPLPPRRPASILLAAVSRPAASRRPETPSPVQEAAAIAPAQ